MTGRVNKALNVLMVEDSAADCALLKALLQKSPTTDYELTITGMLADGVAKLDEKPFDAVILDLSLPDSQGIAACDEIRNAAPSVPIVVLTGLDDESVAIEAVQHGAQDYLVKGAIESGLISRSLRYAIERKRMETELQVAHDDLERRVEKRTEELRQKNRELEEVIRQRGRAEQLARRRQEELAHVARLNTLGEMASGIAHELNQPLTAIVGYARSCLRRLRDTDSLDTAQREELISQLEKAAEQANRGGEIIKRLRRMVGRRESERAATDVNQCVQSVTEMLKAESKNLGIRIQEFLDPDLPQVQADRIQLEQVLLNLVRNGLEAMANCNDGRRVLEIRTAVDKLNNIEVKVIDRGVGMTPEKLGRAFDPFFTTKSDGLGLGLAISRSIVEDHGGNFTVTPNVDHGLSFRFTLRNSSCA